VQSLIRKYPALNPGIPLATGAAAAVIAFLMPAGRNLEYEHVTMAAAMIAVLWPLARIWSPGTTNWLVTALALFTGLSIPGWLMFAFRYCPCSPSGYGQWLLIQAAPSCLLAGCATAWVDRLKIDRSGIHRLATRSFATRARLTAIWIVVVLASLAFLSATLWFYPQKRAVSAFFGFLHGPIYDERIWIHADVMRARLAHALLFCAVGVSASLNPKLKPRPKLLAPAGFTMAGATAALLAVTWAAMTWSLHDSPATGHGQRVLQSQFTHVTEGDGFRLFHHDANGTRSLAAEATFHIRDLREILGGIEFPRVDIYAYRDARTKKIWFGGGATDVTDVWAPGIHVTASPDTTHHPTLRHELVHALTSRVAFHGLGFHPNIALTEGLAVALAPDENIFSVMSMDEAAAELMESGRIQRPENLFRASTFWLESGPRAYTVAGSLIHWLIHTRGVSQVLALYSGKDWQQATGADSAQLIAAWRQDISTRNSTGRNATATRVRASTLFRSGGVAVDVCPHSFADRLAANPDIDSLEYMATHTGDPAYDVIARRREARLIFESNDKSAARELARRVIAAAEWPPRHEEDVELRILALDLIAFSGDKMETNPGLGGLATFHATHPLPVHLARQILVRERLERILPVADALPWRWYLAGWAAIPGQGSDLPDRKTGKHAPWLIDYLRVRNWLRSGAPADVSSQVPGFMNKKIDLALAAAEPDFAFEWYRGLAELLERGSGASQAQALWLKAAAAASNATVRDRMEQNARRAAFATVP